MKKKVEEREEEKKEKKKRKRKSSSVENAAKKASAKPVRTAIPLVIRSVEGVRKAPTKEPLGKGKKKVDESTPAIELQPEPVYYR